MVNYVNCNVYIQMSQVVCSKRCDLAFTDHSNSRNCPEISRYCGRKESFELTRTQEHRKSPTLSAHAQKNSNLPSETTVAQNIVRASNISINLDFSTHPNSSSSKQVLGEVKEQIV